MVRQGATADYSQLCADIVKRAEALGASSSEVHLNCDNGFNVNVRMGETDSLEHHVQQGLTVTVYFGQKTGSAATTDLSEDALSQALEKACSIAKFTDDDEYSGLADEQFLAKEIKDLDLHHPWDILPAEAIALATECEKMGLDADPRIKNSEGVSVSNNETEKFYANSLDFNQSYKKTSHSITSILIAEENGAMQRDYEYTAARDANDLDDIKTLALRAAKKTADRLGAVPIQTCKVPVIFHRELASGFIGNLISAVSGSSQYRKATFLLDHLGKPVLPEWMNITQQPHIPKGLASKPYDSEGVATQDLALVSCGLLENYILSSYSARKLGMETTGNAGGIQNMIVNHSEKSFDDLLKEMGTGFLVTELIGQGVNMLNGDYSRGAFGYWVENGQIQHAVQGVSIAGNLKDMLLNIAAIGSDVERRGSIHCGSILLPEMMVAGT